MGELLVKGIGNVPMLIQALTKEPSSLAKQWLWSQKVCCEFRPSLKACQTRRLELLWGRADPWKEDLSPYCFMELAAGQLVENSQTSLLESKKIKNGGGGVDIGVMGGGVLILFFSADFSLFLFSNSV